MYFIFQTISPSCFLFSFSSLDTTYFFRLCLYHSSSYVDYERTSFMLIENMGWKLEIIKRLCFQGLLLTDHGCNGSRSFCNNNESDSDN